MALKKKKNTFDKVMNELHCKSLPFSPPIYPPAQAWGKVNNESVIRKAWQKTIKQDGHIDLYVHIPFCANVCNFCGLYSKQLKKSSEIDEYLTVLDKEARVLGSMLSPGKIDGLRIGGGTPSLLSPKQIKRLFNIIFKAFSFKSDRFSSAPSHGVVFEAHPRFLTPEKLKVLKEEGTHWIAMGVQSLDDKVLAKTNRAQTAADVHLAYLNIRKAGIPFIANDLMYGLEGQTAESFCRDIDTLIKLKADRIVMYEFCPTGLTPFSKKGGSLMARQRKSIAIMAKKGFDALKARGYKVKDEFHEYWGVVGGIGDRIYTYTYDEYDNNECWHSVLSLGAGAMSVANQNMRYQNFLSVPAYTSKLKKGILPVCAGIELTDKTNMLNHIILNFINSSRVLFKQFEIEFGVSLDEKFSDKMKILISRGMIRRKKTGYFIVEKDRYRVVIEVSRVFFESKVVEKLKTVFKIGKNQKSSSVISLKNSNHRKILAQMIIAKNSGCDSVKLENIPVRGLDIRILKAADKLKLCVRK